jgi:hypothetical protein
MQEERQGSIPIQIVHTTHEPEKPYFPTGSKAG